MISNDREQIICGKCRLPLEEKQTKLSYLGHEVKEKLLCCPLCGQAYVPKQLASGKMAELEKTLEEK